MRKVWAVKWKKLWSKNADNKITVIDACNKKKRTALRREFVIKENWKEPRHKNDNEDKDKNGKDVKNEKIFYPFPNTTRTTDRSPAPLPLHPLTPAGPTRQQGWGRYWGPKHDQLKERSVLANTQRGIFTYPSKDLLVNAFCSIISPPLLSFASCP